MTTGRFADWELILWRYSSCVTTSKSEHYTVVAQQRKRKAQASVYSDEVVWAYQILIPFHNPKPRQ